jgi:hypothetical protein
VLFDAETMPMRYVESMMPIRHAEKAHRGAFGCLEILVGATLFFPLARMRNIGKSSDRCVGLKKNVMIW